ncbi:unnamed protein product [Didymodactylos carnosus]|uniref:Uncharacterized protein n=1 Tax=Didymodactylos carnosus TaxID=1234261 RepID=A0A815Z9A9_9BILA|nr:unnamed protein product [Didymodactylos carnosus]CAF4446706.1 unnamed protein product [Didymodactylos carnosus]
MYSMIYEPDIPDNLLLLLFLKMLADGCVASVSPVRLISDGADFEENLGCEFSNKELDEEERVADESEGHHDSRQWFCQVPRPKMDRDTAASV